MRWRATAAAEQAKSAAIVDAAPADAQAARLTPAKFR